MGFDPFEWESYYFGRMGREEATKLLAAEDVVVGTFLIRDSSHPGEYSLSVRESESGDPPVRHYLIQPKKLDDGSSCVKIAEHSFVDMPMLLNHYKMYLLDKTSLVTPYKKDEIEKVVALYPFDGECESDLPFAAGETLTIIAKDETYEWWQAKNALGTTGKIPANFVTPLNEHERQSKGRSQSSYESGNGEDRFSGLSGSSDGPDVRCEPPSLPCQAKAVLDRQPNAYDTSQLKLKKGQVMKVTKKLENGQYEAELNGKTGLVPFTYIRFIAATTTSL